jgi:hypothetical protein
MASDPWPFYSDILSLSYFNGYFQPKLFLLHPSSKPLVCYLSCLLSCSFWPLCSRKRFYRLSPNLPKKFWHLQVYIFVSKHLNEVWRYNEGHVKDDASLSSRLEDTFRWGDRRVTPSSPPHTMTVHLQSTSFPTMMVTRSSRSWIGVFFRSSILFG